MPRMSSPPWLSALIGSAGRIVVRDLDRVLEEERDRQQRNATPARSALSGRAEDQWADGQPDAQRRLVERDGLLRAATGDGDDGGQRGGDEQGVAQSPSGAPTDQGADGRRRAGQGGEHDDHAEADHQRGAASEPARHVRGDQHGECGDQQVADEQQRDLAGGGAQVRRDGLEDGVDKTDAHEGDHRDEGQYPHRRRLPPTRGRFQKNRCRRRQRLREGLPRVTNHGRFRHPVGWPRWHGRWRSSGWRESCTS